MPSSPLSEFLKNERQINLKLPKISLVPGTDSISSIYLFDLCVCDFDGTKCWHLKLVTWRMHGSQIGRRRTLLLNFNHWRCRIVNTYVASEARTHKHSTKLCVGVYSTHRRWIITLCKWNYFVILLLNWNGTFTSPCI